MARYSTKKIVFLLILSLLVTACVNKEYRKQESIFVVFKTPTLKVADLGFMYENKEEIKIEMYSNGQAVMALSLDKENICMSTFECMDKKSFNQSVLSTAYPEDILRNIFRAEPIFEGANIRKTSNGFTQHLSKTVQYDINYSVLNKHVIFRDTINNILINIKRLK